MPVVGKLASGCGSGAWETAPTDDKKEGKLLASVPASGGDEGDKRDVSPLASDGSSSRHSFWSGAVQSKSKGSKGAEKGKWKGKGKGKPGKLASGSSPGSLAQPRPARA